MNTKRLTIINDDGSERTWRAPFGGRITSDKACIVVTNLVGTEVDTSCYGRPSNGSTPGPGGSGSSTPNGSCGCNGS